VSTSTEPRSLRQWLMGRLMVESGDEAPDPRRPRRIWLASCLAFFLIFAGWAMSLPVNGAPDENEHIVRAYGVATGQLLGDPVTDPPDTRTYQRVPRSLLPEDVDCTWQNSLPASCQKPVDDTASVDVATTAGRYQPIYYLPVGLPMVAWPDTTGIILGRLVSSLMSAMLLASAVTTAYRMGSRLLVGAIVLVVTPTVAGLVGAINPNGLEIVAGVLAWTTLIALLRGPADARTRHLRLFALAGALLCTVRSIGPVWLGLIVLGALLLARPGVIAELWRRRDTRWTLGGLTLLGLAGLAWTMFLQIGTLRRREDVALDLTVTEAITEMIRDRMWFWYQHVVAIFSYGEFRLSYTLILAWYVLFAVLVLPALLTARWRHKFLIVAIFAISVISLMVLELQLLDIAGWTQLARYSMPFGVGAVLVAAVVGWYRRRLNPVGSAWIARALVVGAAPLHLWALAGVMTRFQTGVGASINPFRGEWMPQTGAIAPLVTQIVGLALLVGSIWWFTGAVWPHQNAASSSVLPAVTPDETRPAAGSTIGSGND